MNLNPEIKKGIDPKKYFPESKYIIVYAFTMGERHYFRFDDPLNIPYDRGLKTLVYYRELEMNCDRAFLTAHTEAVDSFFQQGKLTVKDLNQIITLNNQLKQRLQLPKEPDLMYKMAAVVYFDQQENPMTYEFKYGENKIKFWKKNASITDFFLQKPLLELIPYLQHAGENLEQFSQMTQKVTQEHLDNLLPLLSEEQKTKYRSNASLSPAL